MKKLAVIDTSATADCPVRVHDMMVNGEWKRIEFNFGKPTVLDYAVAMKFNLPGFIVRDADENEIAPPPVTSDAVAFQLAPDEIVARYDELTNEALVMRCVVKHGGERFVSGEGTRKEMIGFLLGVDMPETITETVPEADEADEDDEGEEIDLDAEVEIVEPEAEETEGEVSDETLPAEDLIKTVEA